MTDSWKESLQRAGLAVAIVFSLAVLIAVTDPRASDPSSAVGAEALATGRRFPPPTEVPSPTPVPQTTEPGQTTPDGTLATALPIQPFTQHLQAVAENVAVAVGLDATAVPGDDCKSWAPLTDGIAATFRCASTDVVAFADGQIILVSETQTDVLAPRPAVAKSWTWDQGLSQGNFVVVDHGPTDNTTSTITVYSLLTDIDPAVRRGASVTAGQRLGSIGLTPEAAAQGGALLGWELWTGDSPLQVGRPLPAPSADVAIFEATELASMANMPAPPQCGFPAGDRESLPNAQRLYRSGVHQGIDFWCRQKGQPALAFADGTVTMIVSNIVEPSFDEREAMLANAALAGDTPFWTLMSLYGNFVAIDHGEIENVGRVVSIYAHLASVDPELELGAMISAGQPLGENGDSGTAAAARGTTDQELDLIHLHWELQIDDHYLGEGTSGATTEQVYRSLLCQAAETLSCG